MSRMKVPPVIAQFQRPLEQNKTNLLLRLLKKYSPEDDKQRSARLRQEAKDKAESNAVSILRKNYR
jgi:large subunit ribosomal protein L7Ae